MSEAGLVAGTATAIGSLPHRDADAAAALVLRCHPDLPAAPQLPRRSAREGIVAQCAAAIAEVEVHDDGTIELIGPLDPAGVPSPTFDARTHAGLLALLDGAARQPRPPRRVKAQIVGPLTLAVALIDAGADAATAIPLAARAVEAWAHAFEILVNDRLPGTQLVLFFDEPALVLWRRDAAPLEREPAADVLSTVLATTSAVTGVHVCGAGDVRLALDAGPEIVHFDVHELDLDDATALSRFLDGDGWVAWGAIPTHQPVGEHAQPLWNTLVDTWCDLTRRGCDPVRLRSQALIAPACGLAAHDVTQAERALLLAREIGNRVHDQAAATKLTIGA
jgi:hypothetical protein